MNLLNPLENWNVGPNPWGMIHPNKPLSLCQQGAMLQNSPKVRKLFEEKTDDKFCYGNHVQLSRHIDKFKEKNTSFQSSGLRNFCKPLNTNEFSYGSYMFRLSTNYQQHFSNFFSSEFPKIFLPDEPFLCIPVLY